MRGAAQRQEDPPGPHIDGELAAAAAEARGLISRLADDPACERTVLELIELEMRLAELRAAAAALAAQDAVAAELIELGRSLERAEAARRPVPRQRKAGHASPLMAVVRP